MRYPEQLVDYRPIRRQRSERPLKRLLDGAIYWPNPVTKIMKANFPSHHAMKTYRGVEV